MIFGYLREDFVVSVLSLFLAGAGLVVVVVLLRVVVLAGAFTAFVDDFAEERLSVLCVAAGFDTDLLVVVVVVERLFAELCGAEFSVDVLTASLWVERLVVPAF